MEPTVRIGDYFLASRFSYGYSRYSLPFSPPLYSGRILPAPPERGDVVVFRLPRVGDDSVWIARVVGLPGDHVQVINGQLLLNGKPIIREALSSDIGTVSGRSQPVSRWQETLPNGVTYETFEPAGSYMGNTVVYSVPADHYFVMTDNRHFADSRNLSRIGFIPFDNLVGRVDVVLANPSLPPPAAAGMVHGTAMIAGAGSRVER
jgi:signal peptidase I